MEKHPTILEDNTHLSSQLIDFMIGNFEDVSLINNDLSLGRENFPEHDFQQGGFSRTAGAGNKPKISFFCMECDIGQGPMGRLILFPDVI